MLTRRRLLALGSVLLGSPLLSGCQTDQSVAGFPSLAPVAERMDASRYAAATGERYPVAAVDLGDVDPRFRRREVSYATTEPVGTVIVDTPHRYLYLVRDSGRALRYGVGVGREGLEFKGRAVIAFGREWPRWTPTPSMIEREPDRYRRWAGGMDGGPGNPLGARALYLFKGGKDTHFRIHGTTEPQTIGQAVSSGCIRMINQDVIDFYSRVSAGTKVVVLQG